MTNALWLSAVIAFGQARPVSEDDVFRFGFCRGYHECPAADLHYKRATANWQQYARGSGPEWQGRWWGREEELRLYAADAEWRKDAWEAVWWATDKKFDPRRKLERLRDLIGPAAYQLGRMPPPTAAGGWK